MPDTTFDLGSVVTEDVGSLPIHHPVTGAPTSWVLRIAGPGHPETIAIGDEVSRERLMREKDQEQARVNGRKWKGDAPDVKGERDKNFRRAARRILGWSPVTLNGAPFDYSPENAFALLSEPKYDWAAQQFYTYLNDDAAFIEASAKS